MAGWYNASARIPQVPSNVRRESAPFHYLDCTRVQFVSKESTRSRGMDGLPSAESGEESGQAGEGRNCGTGGEEKGGPTGELEETSTRARGDEEARTIERTDQPWAWLIITFMTGHLVHSEP